jgi:hypothetical protein
MRRRRVDGAVAAATLGAGEGVTVVTRLGHPVAEGVVEVASPVGLVVRGSNGVAFFREDVYLFLPRAPDGPIPRHLWVDGAVLREQNAKDTLPGDSPVSAEDLPVDIQQAVSPQAQFGADGVQLVLAAVGEAAMGALKRGGAPAEDLYGIVDAIQQAVMGVVGKYADEAAQAADEAAQAAAEAAGEEEADAEEASGDAEEEDAEGAEAEGAVTDAAAAMAALGGQ